MLWAKAEVVIVRKNLLFYFIYLVLITDFLGWQDGIVITTTGVAYRCVHFIGSGA